MLKMKVLVICSSTAGEITSFVTEQADSLERNAAVTHDYVQIRGKGLRGYLTAYFRMLGKLLANRYDLVHAHYGLSGLIAVMQFARPVVVTFHGCDVNDPKTRWISRIAYRLCAHAIFVESEMPVKLNAKKKFSVIPCGVNVQLFKPLARDVARADIKLDPSQKIALFASAFDIPVKNYELARMACERIEGLKLIELKNFSRREVTSLLNAADLLLLTSIREGSPQIVKEALACNCPIVATNVGDISDRISGAHRVFVCEPDAEMIASKMQLLLDAGARSDGRENIFRDGLDLDSVAGRISLIYKNILN